MFPILNIAVCDDENFELQRMNNLLLSISDKLEIPVHITTFDNSKTLLAAFSGNPHAFDILFLDVYIDEKLGLDIARIVREKNQACVIIFTTAFADKMADSFQYRTSAYLVKPVDEASLTSAMQTALDHLKVMPSLYLRVKGMECSIPYDEIMYIESHLKDLHLFCENEADAVVFPGKLSDLAGTVPKEYFHLCHKSFLVNFSFVRMIDKTSHEVVLKNNTRLPISRTCYQAVLQDFMSFHSKKRGSRR